MTPAIAWLFGVNCLYLMGIVNFPMLVYINIFTGTACNTLIASKNCDRNDNRSLIRNLREK